jgi:glycoprotein-N-acetylgalactosamine 3-beta-galactosyltransferase
MKLLRSIFYFVLCIGFLILVTTYLNNEENSTKNYQSNLLNRKSLKNYKSLLEKMINSTDSISTIVSTTSILTTTTNLKKPARIFCMILTTKNQLYQKAIVINNTWAKDCDKYFFIAQISENGPFNVSYELNFPLPVLHPAGHEKEIYGKLTDKVYRTLQDVYLRYPDYDWYLKADDDTFVFVDNLRLFLSTQNASEPITFGYDFKVIVEKGYHSGGAGYVLSNEALKRIGSKLVNEYRNLRNSGTEDVDVAATLRTVGVYPKKSLDDLGRERFHPLDVATHLKGGFPDWMLSYASNPINIGAECCSDTSISFHYLSPKYMQKLYILWNNFKQPNGLNKTMNFTSLLFSSIF